MISKVRPNSESPRWLQIAEGLADTCHAASQVNRDRLDLDPSSFRCVGLK